MSGILAQYERVRAELAELNRIDQAVELAGEINDLKFHARRVGDRALLAEATAYQMRVERKLGQMMAQAKEAGQLAAGRPAKPENGLSENPFPRVTLGEAGIDKNLADKARKAAGIGAQAFEALIEQMRARMAAGRAILVDPVNAAEKDARHAARRADHAARTAEGGTVADLEALAASGFRAGAILADPPWLFRTRSAAGEGRSANLHYKTDGIEAIMALPVAALAADDCVLFMWMVDWCPADALAVIAAWGFEHKTTAFTWAKQNADGSDFMGQGYWTRANPEVCWLATKGKPKRLDAGVRQLLTSPIGEHSAKPDAIYERIERLVGGPYLEVYARRPRPGWLSWGNELPAPELASLDEDDRPDPALDQVAAPVDQAGAPVAHDDAGEVIEDPPSTVPSAPEPDPPADLVEAPIDPARETELDVICTALPELEQLKAIADFCYPDRPRILAAIAPDLRAAGLARSVAGGKDWQLSEQGMARLAELKAAAPAPKPKRSSLDHRETFRALLGADTFEAWLALAELASSLAISNEAARDLIGRDHVAVLNDDRLALTEAGHKWLRSLEQFVERSLRIKGETIGIALEPVALRQVDLEDLVSAPAAELPLFAAQDPAP